VRTRRHRSLERRLRGILPAPRDFERGQLDVRAGAIGLQCNRVFDGVEGAVEVAQAGPRAGLEDVRVHVGRVTLQDAFDADARLVELPGEEQRLDRIELRGGVMRQQVGRSHELLQRVARVIDRGIRAGETMACVAEERILLDRVAVRQNCLFVALFFEIDVAAL
jgi:hypothetical protein